MKELSDIQSELKVPKDRMNEFGKYKYRSCENILEAVKPLCKEKNCYLKMTDKIIQLGDRFYVEATVTIFNLEGKFESATAIAREALVKKGMDEAQITGSASSYARKYALSGLFAIDDTKDIDGTKPDTAEEDAPQVDLEARKRIDECKTVDELMAVYKEYLPKAKNQASLLSYLSKKKKEVMA